MPDEKPLVNVAIVGAGLAGIGAARTIQAAGHRSVIFEAESHVGGRVSTLRTEGFTFDIGAQNFAAEGTALEHAMLHEIDTSDLVLIEQPIFTHDGRHATPGDSRKNQVRRYSFRSGADALPRLLAQELDVRLNSPVESIGRSGSRFELKGDEFDAVILCIPLPLANPILEALGERRRTAQCTYRSCIAAMLGYDFELSTPYYALIDPDSAVPCEWIAIESAKCPGRAPAGHSAVVVQFSAPFSRSAAEWDHDRIIRQAESGLANILGDRMLRPIVSHVKTWKHSQPEEIAMFSTVNPQKASLIVAGDGTMGGRTELAYESGIKAAKLILEAF